MNSKKKIVEFVDITKTFGSTIANDKINIDLREGEILSLLGENGSGKTTLMNMLAGIYYPDDGQIFINGKKAVITSPIDAYKYNIGMIHQHFKLVNLFTGADNIILGEKVHYKIKDLYSDLKCRWQTCFPFYLKVLGLPLKKFYEEQWLTKKRAKKLQDIVERYGFNIDLSKKIYNMSVSEKQKVEIIKALYKGANILILDEPTAVLTPQETKKLFKILRKMRREGKSIIIITHKLNEVMEISDRIAILRKGKHIATVETSKTTKMELTDMMVGQKVHLNIHRTIPKNSVDRLKIENLNVKNSEGLYALKDISFTAKSGEILGIAGIAGSGQKELLEAIAGLNKIDSGKIEYFTPEENTSIEIQQKNANQINQLGINLAFVPEDRLGMGLVGNMDLVDNMMLRSYSNGRSFFLDRKTPKNLADSIVEKLEVATPSIKTPVRKLSGGNVQKVLLGREIASNPSVLMAAYPVRGLDINSSYVIYNLLNKQKENGASVIFVGEDLDVLLALSDRILVLCGGKISGILDARHTSKEQIGLLMSSVPENVVKYEGIYDNEENNENKDEDEELFT